MAEIDNSTIKLKTIIPDGKVHAYTVVLRQFASISADSFSVGDFIFGG